MPEFVCGRSGLLKWVPWQYRVFFLTGLQFFKVFLDGPATEIFSQNFQNPCKGQHRGSRRTWAPTSRQVHGRERLGDSEAGRVFGEVELLRHLAEVGWLIYRFFLRASDPC